MAEYLRFSHGGYDPVSIAIRLLTRSRFAHVDLVVGQCRDKVLVFGAYKKGGVGSRWVPTNGAVYVTLPQPIFPTIRRYAYTPYDLWGAIATVFHFAHPWRRDDHWFCSELIAIGLEKLNLIQFDAPYGVTPGSLWRACLALNWPIVEV